MDEISSSQTERTNGEKRKPKLSIVVTLYNEADNVEPMTHNLLSALQDQLGSVSFELVLVLNGSLDQTPEKAKVLAQKHPQIVLVSLETNQGYGGGIRAGLAAASGELVGYTDADEQISAQDVAKVFSLALNQQHDLVKAVRITRHDGFQRIILTRVFNSLFRTMFAVTNKDINAKPKVFKRSALNRMTLLCNDWFIDSEVMIQAKKLNFTVEEIPLNFSARTKGRSNVRFSTIWEFLSNMWKFRYGQN